MDFTLQSSAFDHKGSIPVKYSCDGKNISPELSWSGAPDNTQTYALIVDDPDAPGTTFVHWVLYNIPASTSEIPEDAPDRSSLQDGSLHGTNDFGNQSYGGPCPPGGTHRYYFKLYAVDKELDLESGASKQDVLDEIHNHVLAEARLMGKYSRD